MEQAMAPHSSTLAWKIPWTEEPGRLRSMGSQRVGHDWATSLSLFTFMHWRRKWPPTPVFLPGESQGMGSLVSCRLRGHTESDTTEVTWQQQQQLSVSSDVGRDSKLDLESKSWFLPLPPVSPFISYKALDHLCSKPLWTFVFCYKMWIIVVSYLRELR